jgi:hypothetical protein
LVTVSWKLLPGAPEGGVRVTWTPLATTTSVPEVVVLADGSLVDVAVTVKGYVPDAVPAATFSVKESSRRLLAPGGTSIALWPNVAVTPDGSPAAVRVKVSSADPVLINCTE